MKDVRHKICARALRRTTLAVTAVVALWLPLASGLARAGDVYSEEAVKAAFMLRFTSYVTWPGKSTGTTPFRIAVLGDKGMTARLRALVENRSVGGRPIEVNQIGSMAEARTAQLLYVGNRRSTDLPALLPALRDSPILIVTDAANGLEAGSTINFLIADQRVRFEVSMEAARRAGLVVSSDLLSAAVRVQGGHTQSLLSREQNP